MLLNTTTSIKPEDLLIKQTFENNDDHVVTIKMPNYIDFAKINGNHQPDCCGFTSKDFDLKENKDMSSIGMGDTMVRAKQKLQQKYDEKGFITGQDLWDVLNINTKKGRCHYDKRIIMDKTEGPKLSRFVEDELEYEFKNTYLPIKLPFGLNPSKMWQTDNGYTTVEWSDGTTTSVSTEDSGHATPYGGFCACVVKKLYGSTGQAIKMMEHADKNAKWPAEKKRIEREKLKKIRQANAEMRKEKEKKRREHLIEMRMEEIYAKREAERRIAEADEKKVYEP